MWKGSPRHSGHSSASPHKKVRCSKVLFMARGEIVDSLGKASMGEDQIVVGVFVALIQAKEHIDNPPPRA